MTKEIYLNSRKALIAEAQQLIDKGDIKAYTEKENAIKQLMKILRHRVPHRQILTL